MWVNLRGTPSRLTPVVKTMYICLPDGHYNRRGNWTATVTIHGIDSSDNVVVDETTTLRLVVIALAAAVGSNPTPRRNGTP